MYFAYILESRRKLKCDTVHLPLPILRQFVLEKQNQKKIKNTGSLRI